MDVDLRVHVTVSPPLLADLVQQAVMRDGLALGGDDQDCLGSIVTSDHVGESRSRIVIMLGDSSEGDVRVIVDGQETESRAILADELHDSVIDLARSIPPSSA